jgi:hypothetical protein
MVVGYWLGPKFNPSDTLKEDVKKRQAFNTAVDQAATELDSELKRRNQTENDPQAETHLYVPGYVNPILGAEVKTEIYSTWSSVTVSARHTVFYGDVQTFIRFDALILYTGIWGVCTFALVVLVRSQQITVAESPSAGPTRSAEEFLTEDVLQSRARAIELYSRSTLMLVAGIVMAFIGVAVFYVSLPEYGAEKKYLVPETLSPAIAPDPVPMKPADYKIEMLSYLAHGIRPFGILVFLEGIAWFLLRQYRALIEDYKSFHRMYLRRANCLIAFKTLSDKDAPQDRLLVLVASLLGEDLSGRLKQGESTETNEAVKNIEPNPVFALVTSMLDVFKQKSA